MRRERDAEYAAAAIMSLLALAVAGALVGVRDDLDNANVALVLMTIVVIAAIVGGRIAGLAAALTSSLSFNFFHTAPYGSLRINRGNDMITVALLFVSGLIVGEVANRRRATTEVATSRGIEVERLRDVARRVADSRPLTEVWAEVQRGLVEALGVTDVWFESADATSVVRVLPRVDSRGVVETPVHHWVGTGFALPKEGVQLTVGRESDPYGRVILRGDHRRAVNLEDRVFALALMELLALAISQRPGERLADLAPMPVLSEVSEPTRSHAQL
jgi:K+-sensing histidine kinase KdpD